MPIQKVVIFTLGTRGDVQPYIYLARALKNAGFAPTIATHPCWKSWVSDAGVGFAPIGPDIDISREAAAIRGKSVHWLVGAIRTMQFVFKIIKGATGEIYGLCRNADLVIASHSHAGAIEAQACHKPMISVTLQPEMIPQPLKPRTGAQWLSEKLVGAFVNPMLIGPYNKIRQKYRLQPIRAIDEIMSPYLDLIPVSSYVVPKNPYWEKIHRVVGYWYEENEEFKPAPELLRFLESGSQPVIVALGAMAFESGEEKSKLDILIHAFQRTGMRAVIQGFEETLKHYELPATVMRAGSIPHSWLFRRGYCVIHHGGFGTSASAMLAGKPSIVIPHVLDQFLWADRIYGLHAGMKPIRVNEWNERTLMETIERLKAGYDSMADEVRRLSRKMKEENGLQTAAALIQQVCRRLDAECV